MSGKTTIKDIDPRKGGAVKGGRKAGENQKDG